MKRLTINYFKIPIFIICIFLSFNEKLFSQEFFSFFSWSQGQTTATNWRSDPSPLTTPGFPAGSNYTGCLYADINIANSAAEWVTNYPRYAYNTIGMPAAAGYGMRLQTNWTTSNRVVTYTITFKSSSGGPVSEYPVEFSIYDINSHLCGAASIDRFIDAVSVVGYRQNLSTVVNPTYANAANSGGITCTNNIVTGNWIKGGDCGASRTNVTFPNNVARIIITYTSGIGHPANLNCGTTPAALVAADNPRSQEILFSPFKINNPSAPTAPSAITGGASVCSGNNITLTGTGATATSIWYTGSCGGTQFGTGTSITISPTSNTTYWVANVGGLCGTTLSSCASLGITVTSPPTISAQPSAASICSTGSSTISVTASGGPYQWQYFNGSTWNNVVNGTPTGFTYANSTTNNLSITTSGATTGTYPFRCVIGSACTLNSSTANVTITGPATTGMAAGDWVWTGAQSVIYELAGNWLSWNGTVLTVPATPPTSVNNVRIKPTTGCVLNQPTITNSIQVIDVAGSANCRDIIIENGATLTYTNTALPNNAHFHITGNYNNQGTVVPGTGRVKFVRNSGSQTITDASGTATFYEMNVASTSTAVLSSSVTVTNAIRLPGVISTGTNRVYLNTTAVDNGSTTGFVTYTGHVFGNLRRRVVTNTNSYFFPVGVSNVLNTGRRLLEWINNSTTGITDLDCRVSNTFKGSGNNIDSQLDITNKAKSFVQVMGFVCPEAEWTLTPNTSITGGDYGLRLYLQNFAPIADNKFTILKRPDNSTTFFDFNTFYLTTTIPSFGNPGRVYSGGAGNAEKQGFTTFSKFVVATSLEVLPVELINYNIICSNEKPYITWQTVSEQNNNYFSVDRSIDGETFNSIATINSIGNSLSLQSYSYIDPNPLPSISYYRLSQTDLNGVTTSLSIKSYKKNCSDIPFDIVALSNPFDNVLSLNLNYNKDSQITLSIYDNLGQLVKTIFDNTIMDGNTSKITIDTENLATSIYYLRGFVNNEPFNLKLIKIK
jgi:hypothetical protein